MTAEQQDQQQDAAPAQEAAPAMPESGWPELDKLVEDIKTKRTEEQVRAERQRTEQQKMQQDAEKAWQGLQARASLDELAARLADLGVAAKPVETLSGMFSAAMEFSKLPKGESATVRVDTSPGRNGPRTTVQVQRGNQQMSPIPIASSTNGELRHNLVEVAQKLLG
jgi:crotonobetainyl-CoA:carnitine CoA-transferase CaiB-like acyl-CoA transferase